MANKHLEWLPKRSKLKELVDRMIGKHKLEREVDADFLDKLKELPFKVAAKKNLGGTNNLNEPDWFICVNGRLLLIETKRPVEGNRKKIQIREGQRIRAKWWQRAGAKYVVCDDSDRMIEAVRELHREQEAFVNHRGEELY